jgi:hypothetical protein
MLAVELSTVRESFAYASFRRHAASLGEDHDHGSNIACIPKLEHGCQGPKFASVTGGYAAARFVLQVNNFHLHCPSGSRAEGDPDHG